MKSNGEFEKKVISSIVEGITADQNRPSDINWLIEMFENATLQMTSFTITEKGYALTNPN